MTTRLASALVTAACVLAAMAGCSSDSSTPAAPPAAAPVPGKPVDPATAGSISGRVTFDGPAPAPQHVRMSSDPGCVQAGGPNPVSDAVLVGADGALQNAFVYIKAGLDPSYTFDVPATPVELDQKGCVYAPRVVGVRVGQPLVVSNSDPTFHNVHATPTMNREFNQGLAVQGSHLTHTFTAPEVMMRFKCDVHGWMAAWVGVVAHPFFAVTGADGSFSLQGVPPGTYTIEAWHERFGRRTAQVVVGDRQAATTSFTFTAG